MNARDSLVRVFADGRSRLLVDFYFLYRDIFSFQDQRGNQFGRRRI